MPPISGLPAAAGSDAAGVLAIVLGGVTYKISVSSLLQLPGAESVSLQAGNHILSLTAGGEVLLRNASGSRIRFEAGSTVDIEPQDPGGVAMNVGPGGYVVMRVDTNPVAQAVKDGAGNYAFQLYGVLATGNAFAGSTLGTVVAGLAVYDPSGVLVGYLPLYDTIT